MLHVLQAIAAVATTVAVLAGAASLRQIQRQKLRAYEDFYVSRYWKIMDELSLSALKGELGGGTDDERAIRSYLILCEDELEVRAEGLISDLTWRIWAPAIASQVSRRPYDEVWNTVQREANQPFARLTRFMGDQGDPCQSGWLGRCLRGQRGFFAS